MVIQVEISPLLTLNTSDRARSAIFLLASAYNLTRTEKPPGEFSPIFGCPQRSHNRPAPDRVEALLTQGPVTQSDSLRFRHAATEGSVPISSI